MRPMPAAGGDATVEVAEAGIVALGGRRSTAARADAVEVVIDHHPVLIAPLAVHAEPDQPATVVAGVLSRANRHRSCRIHGQGCHPLDFHNRYARRIELYHLNRLTLTPLESCWKRPW